MSYMCTWIIGYAGDPYMCSYDQQWRFFRCRESHFLLSMQSSNENDYTVSWSCIFWVMLGVLDAVRYIFLSVLFDHWIWNSWSSNVRIQVLDLKLGRRFWAHYRCHHVLTTSSWNSHFASRPSLRSQWIIVLWHKNSMIVVSRPSLRPAWIILWRNKDFRYHCIRTFVKTYMKKSFDDIKGATVFASRPSLKLRWIIAWWHQNECCRLLSFTL